VMSVRRRERLTEKGTNREEGKHAECGRQSDKQSGREADARSVERMVWGVWERQDDAIWVRDCCRCRRDTETEHLSKRRTVDWLLLLLTLHSASLPLAIPWRSSPSLSLLFQVSNLNQNMQRGCWVLEFEVTQMDHAVASHHLTLPTQYY